jgi:hypothetical protein
LKKEFIPIALKLFMDKSIEDYCKCKNFFSWFDSFNGMSKDYLYNSYRINKDNLPNLRTYLDRMKESCASACLFKPEPNEKPNKKPHKKPHKKPKKKYHRK